MQWRHSFLDASCQPSLPINGCLKASLCKSIREFKVVKIYILLRYITGLFVERTFGTSEYHFQLRKSMKALCQYEQRYGAVVPAPVIFPLMNFK